MLNLFVVNPVAGKGKYAHLLDRIHEACHQAGVEYEVRLTQWEGHATQIVEEYCEKYPDVHVFACGGDGTLGECCAGMVDFPDAVLGCVPCGTGNDFVRNFPGHDFADIAAQLQGSPFLVDLLRVRWEDKDKYCINLVSIGLDSQAAISMNRFKRWPLITGGMAYILGIISSLFHLQAVEAAFTLDGEVYSGRYLLSVCANGEYYGGGFHGSPQSKLDDGQIDWVAIEKVGLLKIAKLIGIYKKGEHIGNPRFEGILSYRRARSIQVKSERPFPVTVDGEGFYTTEMEVALASQKVYIQLPKK